MSVTLNPADPSVVAQPGQTISVSSMLDITASASNPEYVVVSLLDRNEYTAASTGETGKLNGNGNSASFSNAGGDFNTVGIVFTYNAATGQYTNATYGNLSSLTYTASTNTNDNTSLSVFTTNNLTVANNYVNDPTLLQELAPMGYTNYVGSVSIVTQPAFAGPAPTQATPDSIKAAALSFVGKAWNDEGCWVLASNISAEAGASLPITSTSVGLAGVANGEWIVAYNGPAGQTSENGQSWESQITAGEMVVFETTSGGGHITTVVSGSGSSAELVDNIEYVNGSGTMTNSANDGSANDVIIAAPHAASQEWSQVAGNEVVVYELDCPIITTSTATTTVAAGMTEAIAPLFTATNPLAAQSITEYQVYDSGTGSATGSFMVGSTDTVATSAADALTITASQLSSLDLVGGSGSGVDTVDVRAYNGSYWGDWATMTVDVTHPSVIVPPNVTAQTANQTWALGHAVNFALASNTFTDPQGEAMTYTATQANGSALPSWLTFNAATRTFTGTPPNTANGLSIKVTATDSGGASTSETFAVATPAAPPIVANQTATQTWTEGNAVSFALASNVFTDPQGESMTYAATLANGSALPTWLTFNAATQTFTGTPPAGSAPLSIMVTATDTSGVSTSETFTANLVAPPAPTITSQTANQTWALGQAVNFALAANTFTDPDGEALTYTATQSNGAALPSWLSFNAATKTFTGTPPMGSTGLSIKVIATDAGGASTSETFTVATAAPPAITSQTANQTWTMGKPVSLALAWNTFTDRLNETMTYAATQANGSALPSWLSFNAATKTFTGTPPVGAAPLSLMVTATDTTGYSTSETFTANVVAPPAPTITSQTANQTWTIGKAVNAVLAWNTFTDPDGEALTYTATQANGAALPSWLSFNAATKTFTGTPPMSATGLNITVTATDVGGSSTSETFSVATPAAPPVITAQTAPQTWTMGKAVNLALAWNTFTDPLNEAMTYTATQANGLALPSWLSFNASTKTFTGTPPVGAAPLSLMVTATDTTGYSTSETFTANVVAPPAPTITSQTANQTWTIGKAVNAALAWNTFTDPDGEAMTYTASAGQWHCAAVVVDLQCRDEDLYGGRTERRGKLEPSGYGNRRWRRLRIRDFRSLGVGGGKSTGQRDLIRGHVPHLGYQRHRRTDNQQSGHARFPALKPAAHVFLRRMSGEDRPPTLRSPRGLSDKSNCPANSPVTIC